MRKKLHRLFQTLWPFALFIFFVLIALSFSDIPAYLLAQLFGLAVVLSAAVAWLVIDYVRDSDKRVGARLRDISDLLKPYDGMKLSEMPPEVQAEVRKRLQWSDKKPVPPQGK